MGLNDVCDWLRLKAGVLARFGVTPPSKHALSHANKERSAEFVEKLFWSVISHLQHARPDFAAGRKGKGLLWRFKVKIHAVDSTVIQLVANCTDWAQHRRRWDLEVFFKQIKQNLKLGTFLGHSANAVKWQIFTALLVYVLLRYMAHLADWGHSFMRLFAVTRSALWERLDLLGLLKSYGTASGRFQVIGAHNEAWLTGFASNTT